MNAAMTRLRDDADGSTQTLRRRTAQLDMRGIAFLLLLATLATIPLEDIFQVPGIGTLARATGLMTFATWALAVFARGSMRKPDVFHSFGFGFAIWVGLSVLWSFDSVETLVRVETFLQLFLLSLVIWDLCDSTRAVRSAMQALVLGTWLAAGSVFINFAQGIESNYGRFSASGADPNFMSTMLAMSIPLAWYLALDAERRALRLINLFYIPAAGVAMGLTGSRGGLLAGFVAIAYLVSTIRRLQPAAVTALLIAVAVSVVAVSALVPETTIQRLASVGDEIAQGDLNGREDIWLEAWDGFAAYPVAGIGAGASQAILPTGKVPHNVPITVALELGIVGLALFAGMVAAALRRTRWLALPERRMWLATVGIWAVGALSLSVETRKLTWILFSLFLAAAATAHQSKILAAIQADGLPATASADTSTNGHPDGNE